MGINRKEVRKVYHNLCQVEIRSLLKSVSQSDFNLRCSSAKSWMWYVQRPPYKFGKVFTRERSNWNYVENMQILKNLLYVYIFFSLEKTKLQRMYSVLIEQYILVCTILRSPTPLNMPTISEWAINDIINQMYSRRIIKADETGFATFQWATYASTV